MQKLREKFHTLDALRFFSFMIVFLSHLPYALFQRFSFLRTDGKNGVIFFFVLSGFLISYILLMEKKTFKQIDFKKYIIRRVLRIWPLFYLFLLFAVLTPYIINIIGLNSSQIGYEPNWLLSFLFLENYMVIFHEKYANVSPLAVMWSLCIEEHFYIIWGLILVLFPIKKLPCIIFGIIILSNISRFYFFRNDWLFLELLTNFDYFMFGAIPAYLYVNHKEKTIQRINEIPSLAKLAIVLITIFYILFFFKFEYYLKPLIEPTLLSILFSSIIFIILPTENKFKISDKNNISKLGIYTYGLYLTHTIVINLTIQTFKNLNVNFDENLAVIIFIAISLLTTIFISTICYNIIEKPFLLLKGKI